LNQQLISVPSGRFPLQSTIYSALLTWNTLVQRPSPSDRAALEVLFNLAGFLISTFIYEKWRVLFVKKRALLSVSDKSGILEFAQALEGLGYELLSTGGTMKHLAENGVAVTAVDEITGFPEIMEGRVKTLNPLIHGGLLAKQDDPSHIAQMEEHGIQPIDVVCVNLYPFKETISKPGVSTEDSIGLFCFDQTELS